jgi:hypothetical protein
MASFGISYGVLWVLVLFQAFVAVYLTRQLVELRRRIEGGQSSLQPLPLGVAAPRFSATDLHSGRSIQSSEFVGTLRVLLFLSTECNVCRGLARELAHAAPTELNGLIVYCPGPHSVCQSVLGRLASKVPVLVQDTTDIAGLFRVEGSPVAVLIDEKWRVSGFRYPSSAGEFLASLKVIHRVESEHDLSAAAAAAQRVKDATA